MFIRYETLLRTKERLSEVERAVREANLIAKPTRDHTVIVLCKHDKEARRVKFFDPPPVEFVQDGEVLKYVGEKKESGMDIASAAFGVYLQKTSYFSVYQSSKCSLTCERDGNVINRGRLK